MRSALLKLSAPSGVDFSQGTPKPPPHPALTLGKALAAPAAGAVAGGLSAYGANALSKKLRNKSLASYPLLLAALPALGAAAPVLMNVGMSDVKDEMREDAVERRRIRRGR